MKKLLIIAAVLIFGGLVGSQAPKVFNHKEENVGLILASQTKPQFTVVNTSTINNGGLVVGYTSPTFNAGHLNIDYNGNLTSSGTANFVGALTVGSCSGCGAAFTGRLGSPNIFQVTDGTTTSTLTANALYVATSSANLAGTFNVTSTGDISTSGSLYFNTVQDVGVPGKARIFLDDTNQFTLNAPGATGYIDFRVNDVNLVQINPSGFIQALQGGATAGFWTSNQVKMTDTGFIIPDANKYVQSSRFRQVAGTAYQFLNDAYTVAQMTIGVNGGVGVNTTTIGKADMIITSSTATGTLYITGDLLNHGGAIIMRVPSSTSCFSFYPADMGNGTIGLTSTVIACP